MAATLDKVEEPQAITLPNELRWRPEITFTQQGDGRLLVRIVYGRQVAMEAMLDPMERNTLRQVLQYDNKSIGFPLCHVKAVTP